MSTRTNRRDFLKSSAALGAGSFAATRLPAEDKKNLSDKLRVAIIGVTNQGAYDMNEVVNAGAEVVALCDVDENRAGGARQRFANAKFYADYRKLLDQKGIDAAVIATPDHMHAPITLAALRAGLHVYCEKPLTHTVAEARLVAETAAKHKRVTQMGTQIHAGNNYRRVVELVQSGAIGPVREVHVWCGANWGGGNRPKETESIPQGLHWDLWLGVAAERPFYHGPDKKAFGLYHPYNWRRWWDFGGGAIADMSCHHVDLPFWALKLRHPDKVSAEGPPPHPETAATWLIVHYEYPSRGDLPAVKLTWYDGGKRPKYFQDPKLPKWGDGTLFVGEKGMLIAGYGDHKLLPEDKFTDFKRPEPFIANSIGHHKEWVEACKTGGPTTCDFAYAGPLTEAALLGNVSYRLGKPITWDAKNLKAVNEPNAEQFIHKEYRKNRG